MIGKLEAVFNRGELNIDIEDDLTFDQWFDSLTHSEVRGHLAWVVNVKL